MYAASTVAVARWLAPKTYVSSRSSTTSADSATAPEVKKRRYSSRPDPLAASASPSGTRMGAYWSTAGALQPSAAPGPAYATTHVGGPGARRLTGGAGPFGSTGSVTSSTAPGSRASS